MRERRANELAALAGGRLVGDPDTRVGPDVVIDSRAATPGCLFVALPGEHADGHDFAAAAVAAGAAAVLVGRELDLAVPQLLVEDPAAGLARLGAGLVAEALAGGLVSIAITGSSGKTSTKDLAAQVLAAAGATIAPQGSQNNEIGVPLTAARLGPGTRFLVSELGARGQGHIRWLCEIVTPRVGAVINVGHAHLGEFGTVAGIAQAKGELVEVLPVDGWAVLNADDDLVAAMTSRTAARIAAFAVGAEPAFGELRVWATEISLDARQRPSFTLHAVRSSSEEPDETTATVTLQVSGAHQVANALAAATIALTQGLEVTAVAEALGRAVAQSKWRMELTERADGVLVVNDAYNANPDSMTAALRALAALRRPGGRLLAVLGDMLELGPAAAAEHRAIGRLAAELGIDQLIVIGSHAADLAAGAEAAGLAVSIATDSAAAAAAATAWLRAADVVLVKASRGLALEAVAGQLIAAGQREG